MNTNGSAGEHAYLFQLDEPPTMPGRTPAGGVIKAPVIRGIATVLDATKEASAALDKLIEACRTLPPSSKLKAAAR